MNPHAANAILSSPEPDKVKPGLVPVLGTLMLLGLMVGGYFYGVQYAFGVVFHPIDAFQTVALITLVILLSLPAIGISRLFRGN